MARILFSTYMVRYPLGGMLSWAIQYALGFRQLGHEVYLLERANYPGACYDPEQRHSGDDCRANYGIVHELLKRFELEHHLIFQAMDGTIIGSTQSELTTLFRDSDVLIDGGNHGAWLPDAKETGIPTILIDGEPGYTQVRMALADAEGALPPSYDYYYSNGANIGTARSTAPTGGRQWRHVFNPVSTQLIPAQAAPANGNFTTVMNWQSHSTIEFGGRTYGQKDQEFVRFIRLPRLAKAPIEVAVSGRFPEAELRANDWKISDAQKVTDTYDSYHSYITASMGEFSVCKNVFVDMRTGWFSDRSAAYLAAGRPVILQETGFSEHLPCGRGLFAVSTPEEAAAAIDAIMSNYRSHSRGAREIAEAHLDATTLMKQVLSEVGL